MPDDSTSAPAQVAVATCPDPKKILEEAHALTQYIAGRGGVLKSAGGSALSLEEAEKRKTAYTALVAAVASARCDPSPSPTAWQNLMGAYATVSAFTYAEHSVNGRTILDTMGCTAVEGPLPSSLRRFFSTQARLMWWAAGLFAAVIVFTLASAWVMRRLDLERLNPNLYGIDGIAGVLVWMIPALLPLLAPAIWGGLGACVFLMKRQAMRLANMTYEKDRVRGEPTRLCLGAAAGVIVVTLVPGLSGAEPAAANLSDELAAFAAGLGFKPVYAAFEAISDGLARRISGKGGGK